jgi:cobalt/nickel transport system permease protein
MTRLETALVHLGSLDELAARETPLAGIDPRAKVAVTIAYVAVVASFGPAELLRLAPLAAYPAVLLALGDVPPGPLLWRLALASPFALGVAAFEPLLHRAPVALGPLTVSEGWLAFAAILAKFVLSLGAALLLVATTGFDDVCAALRRLGAPRVLVTQLLFTYRYLFVLAGEAARMVRAHDLRAPGGGRPRPRVAAQLVGQLLLRTLDRAQRIHAAMACRGFDGTVPFQRPRRLRPPDLAFAASWLAFFALARAVDLPAWIGAILTGSPA